MHPDPNGEPHTYAKAYDLGIHCISKLDWLPKGASQGHAYPADGMDFIPATVGQLRKHNDGSHRHKKKQVRRKNLWQGTKRTKRQ